MNAKKKVLLVDDDADFIAVNKAVLEDNGYEVMTACNGQECLESVRELAPDLIVLDVMMTTVDEGFEVARQIQFCGETAKITPIIMVTSIDEKHPFSFGPDKAWIPVEKYLEKPVAPDQLLQEVRARLA